jgi:uncharacterized protein YkwD
MVNDERASAGASPLAWCDGLHACAKAHSNDIYTFTPIVSNPYGGLAENIAMGQTSPTQVMTGWMNSPGHRANILNTGYSHIGVGLCDGCGTHWTQNFGSR